MKTTPKRSMLVNRYSMIFFVVVIIVLVSLRAVSAWQQRLWNYQGRLTILDADALVVTSYPSDGTDIVQLTLPPELYIDVPGGYGAYRLKNVAELSNVETKGNSLLIRAVSSFLGLPVNATAKDLGRIDRFLVQRVEQEKTGKAKTIDFTTLPIYSKETRSDGEVIEHADQDKVDYYMGDMFWEKAIKDEHIAIGIFNASNQQGVASDISRRLEKIGIQVVELGNSDVKLSGCEIHPSVQAVNTVTFKRLHSILPCQVKEATTQERKFDISIIIADPI